MKSEDVKELNHGLYKIFWKRKHGGGMSLASVGSTSDGTRWYAPSNWTCSDKERPIVASTNWKLVKKVEQIL